MNYSWQRQVILDAIQNCKRHMTAAEVYNEAIKACPRLSLGTVYRNLNTLVDIGSIRRVGVPGEADRFDWELPAHQHFFCHICKKVENLPINNDKLHGLLTGCDGIRVENYQLLVTGVCAECTATGATPSL